MGLTFGKINPGFIYAFNVNDKNSMWLPGFRKKTIEFVIQDFSSIKDIFLKGHVKKTIQFSEAEVAANIDVTPISIHVQRFTGHVYGWSILNELLKKLIKKVTY